MVDTLLAELGESLNVLGDVVGGADGSESTYGGGQCGNHPGMRGTESENFPKERSRTGQSEENDLLVGKLLGGIVVDGDTTRLNLLGFLGPGDVTESGVNWGVMVFGLRGTHENLTSAGKASPTLKPLVILKIGSKEMKK